MSDAPIAEGNRRHRSVWLLVWTGAAVATPVILWLIVWLVLPRLAPASAYAIALQIPVSRLPIAHQLLAAGKGELEGCLDSTDQDRRNHYAWRALDRLEPAYDLVAPLYEQQPDDEELQSTYRWIAQYRYAARKFQSAPRP